MLPWSAQFGGRIEEHAIESYYLRDNPLGDHHERPLWVYVPPGYDDEPDRHYPSVYVIQGYTGTISMWRNRAPFRQTFPELADAVFVRHEAPPAIVVYVDTHSRSPGCASACRRRGFLLRSAAGSSTPAGPYRSTGPARPHPQPDEGADHERRDGRSAVTDHERDDQPDGRAHQQWGEQRRSTYREAVARLAHTLGGVGAARSLPFAGEADVHREVAGQRQEVVPGLRGVGRAHPLLELIRREPSVRRLFAQNADDAFPVVVGDS